MVRVRIAGIDVFVGEAFQVIGDDEAVQGDGVGHAGNVFHICVSGAVPEGIFFFLGEKVQAESEVFRKVFPGEGISPGFVPCGIILGGFEVMVEVTAAEDVISSPVFCLHVVAEHADLAFPDGVAVSVGGHMKFKNYQFFAVFHRDPGDAVAAVQVEKFGKRSGDREASPQGGSDRISGKQCQTRSAAAMRLRKRIKKESRWRSEGAGLVQDLLSQG